MGDGNLPSGWWVNAGRWPRLFALPIDARAAIPLPAWAIYPSWITFFVAVGAVAMFTLLAWRGMTAPNALRAVRARVRGRWIYARPWHYRKRFRARGF